MKIAAIVGIVSGAGMFVAQLMPSDFSVPVTAILGFICTLCLGFAFHTNRGAMKSLLALTESLTKISDAHHAIAGKLDETNSKLGATNEKFESLNTAIRNRPCMKVEDDE